MASFPRCPSMILLSVTFFVLFLTTRKSMQLPVKVKLCKCCICEEFIYCMNFCFFCFGRCSIPRRVLRAASPPFWHVSLAGIAFTTLGPRIYLCIYVYIYIYIYIVISELNKEFQAIWLVERFVLWRYIHRAMYIFNSYSSRTRRIWVDIYNQRGRRPSWLLSAHIQQVREE